MAEQEAAAEGYRPGDQGATRRGMLRGAVGMGAAGLAAGVLAGAVSRPAAAATAEAGAADDAVAHDEPLVAHVHDASTGVVDLYTGTRHVRLVDRQLAARLSRATR